MTLPLWPPTASAFAGQVDLLLAGLLTLVSLLTLPVFVLLLVFAIRYREGSPANRQHRAERNVKLEVSWALIPFALSLVFFVWAAKLYFDEHNAPPGALEIDVLAKQWMWKFEHPGGQREINELHVPARQPVRLVDDLPGRDPQPLSSRRSGSSRTSCPGATRRSGSTPTGPATYHLFCAEFCGTEPFRDGRPARDHDARGLRGLARAHAVRPLARGEWGTAVPQLGCSGCHVNSKAVHAPPLDGRLRQPGAARRGARWSWPTKPTSATASCCRKKAVVAGYEPIMPSFSGPPVGGRAARS